MLATSKRGVTTPRSIGSGRTVAQTADQLILAYGDRALETANVYASRETGGLLYSAEPDYWQRVRRELEGRSHQVRDAQAAPNLHAPAPAGHKDQEDAGLGRSRLAA